MEFHQNPPPVENNYIPVELQTGPIRIRDVLQDASRSALA